MEISNQKVIIRVIFILISLLVSCLLLITTVDTSNYSNASFYQSTLARKDSLVDILHRQQGQEQQSDGLHAGWGVANITPTEPVRLTGINFKPYQQVFDSVYVRTMLFENGSQQVVVLSYDLWIIHPTLADYIRERVHDEFPKINGIYFTANHTHTSIGGWASGLLGALIVGGNHPGTLDFIGAQTLRSIRQAKLKLSKVKVGYGHVNTTDLVTNRLDENGVIDDKLRVLKLVNENELVAAFNTFSAHSVYMNKDINTLSADYPGSFTQLLQERQDIDFASFAPGATGSHTPIGRKPFERSKMLEYSRKLADNFEQVNHQIKTDTSSILRYVQWPVDLRSPHFRISNHWRFRPWLFNTVMGKPEASITAMRIGNMVLVGLPIELSGEYYHEFDTICKERGLSLMITSFNGWYLGYANPEKYYYTVRQAETREMNWFGPQSGEYFVDLVNELLKII